MNIFQTHKSLDYIKKNPELKKAVYSWYIYKKKRVQLLFL